MGLPAAKQTNSVYEGVGNPAKSICMLLGVWLPFLCIITVVVWLWIVCSTACTLSASSDWQGFLFLVYSYMAAKRWLTDDEIQRILKQGFVGENYLRDRAMFAMGISTGYRIGEIVQHRIKDVVGYWVVKDVIELPSRFRKGGAKGQSKWLHSFAKKAMQAYIDHRRMDLEGNPNFKEYWLFESKHRDRRNRFRKHITTRRARMIINEAFERLDITGAVGSHSMRKTFAKKKYDKGCELFREGKIDIDPIRYVQLHLGHVNINSTIKYLESIISVDPDESQFEYEI